MSKQNNLADGIKCPPGHEMIIMEIGTDLKPLITVKGVDGSSCKDLTADIEKALGTKISDVPTADMAKNPTTSKQRNENKQR